MTTTRFRIRQNDMTVCQADEQKEILHYADQYRRDGEITIQYHTGTHWKRFATFCQWPVLNEVLK